MKEVKYLTYGSYVFGMLQTKSGKFFFLVSAEQLNFKRIALYHPEVKPRYHGYCCFQRLHKHHCFKSHHKHHYFKAITNITVIIVMRYTSYVTVVNAFTIITAF
jgi:hypothetical protein